MYKELPPFHRAEFEERVSRACKLMTRGKLDGLLITGEANMEYLSGFTTQFAWNSPSRPWYFLLLRNGKGKAVIPELGAENWLRTSWCDDVQTWPSPRPKDEGLKLLQSAIGSMKKRYGRIGAELGAESRLGMPVADLLKLKNLIRPLTLVDAIPLLTELRMVKSKAEIRYIKRCCDIASDAFDAMPSIIAENDTERTLVRKFQARMLLNGADKTPFCAIGSGRGGYSNIVMGPTGRKIRNGDIFLIDTGARYGGYFCDFDRNYSMGPVSDAAKRAQELLYLATAAGIAAARPGNTAEEVFKAQAGVLMDNGVKLGNVGRFGHGLGKVLTEPPSNRIGDHTVLKPGMVLTIEPNCYFGKNKILVHEENLVITEGKPRLLSRRAPREMVEIF